MKLKAKGGERMFVHSKSGKVYYSVREKINHYKAIIAGKKQVPDYVRARAERRLRELQALEQRSFDEPTLVVTNDSKFGNPVSKPRLCVVVDKDDKGRLYVAAVHHRTSNSIILDKQIDRQVDERKKWIDRSEVYDTKLIKGVKPLTRYDRAKIRFIHKRK